jgi:hypothetical protein
MLALALIALWLVPCAFLLLASYQFWYEWKFSNIAQNYSGRIVRHAVSHAPARVLAPVVEWQAPDRVARQFRSASWSSFKRYAEGESVNVLFGLDIRGKPRVCIDSHLSRDPYILMLAGLAGAVLAWKISCLAGSVC